MKTSSMKPSPATTIDFYESFASSYFRVSGKHMIGLNPFPISSFVVSLFKVDVSPNRFKLIIVYMLNQLQWFYFYQKPF